MHKRKLLLPFCAEHAHSGRGAEASSADVVLLFGSVPCTGKPTNQQYVTAPHPGNVPGRYISSVAPNTLHVRKIHSHRRPMAERLWTGPESGAKCSNAWPHRSKTNTIVSQLEISSHRQEWQVV
uniref:Uncharacterized protein n=1 Tax=Eutreptiella gymnastica TaxID=73025 RepID=A0A7S4GF09_9EUGL